MFHLLCIGCNILKLANTKLDVVSIWFPFKYYFGCFDISKIWKLKVSRYLRIALDHVRTNYVVYSWMKRSEHRQHTHILKKIWKMMYVKMHFKKWINCCTKFKHLPLFPHIYTHLGTNTWKLHTTLHIFSVQPNHFIIVWNARVSVFI